ncbi:MAG TPA: hypothetical protein QGG18_08110, partial [Rhodospirillales bacterium]|nr:hypothetical protein [Rhodospirillales bacterium]
MAAYPRRVKGAAASLKIGSIDPILITGAKNQGNDKMADTQQQMTGACLCGAVAYLVSGPMRNVIACHCGQCQRTHGHYAAYSNCALEDFRLTNSRGLKWYRS